MINSLIEKLRVATFPPAAYPFILWRASFPIALTAAFFITNSPGINLASTESVSPLPGTNPPLANLLTGPPEFIPGPPPILLPSPLAPPDPLIPLKNPLPNCTAADAPLNANITPKTGNIPLILSAALIKALVTDSAPLAIAWKLSDFPISLNRAKNCSRTLAICTANDSWAFVASAAKEPCPV